jgi:beta-glucuronidase
MQRERIDLTGLWRFQPDAADTGEAGGYASPDHDTRFWREVMVPCALDACLPGMDFYCGTGWFRRRFSVPDEWQSRRVVLRFEGVNFHSAVWVNGKLVAENEDGYLRFDVPVAHCLQYGRDNVVAVRVDNYRRRGEVPGMERGWRNTGGILRPVELVSMDRLRVGRTVVLAEPGEDGGQLALRVRVHNDRDAAADAVVTAQVTDADGALVAECPARLLALEPGGCSDVELAATVPGAVPWSPDSPVLYAAQVDLTAGETRVDTVDVRFGFRRIEAVGERLLLNGSQVFLTGFNRHEDSARSDACSDLETARRDLQDMKRMGCNFVRLCHYPHDPRELDLCDELGLLAMCEIPLYWWNGLEEGEGSCASKLDAAKRQLTRMIERDAAHPSVIFWSVSNETRERRPEVARGNAELVRLAQELDPSRPACHVSDNWSHAEVGFEADDVVCVNAYPSCSWLWSSPPATPPADPGATWRAELQALHERNPGKPILVTEFGHPSFEGAAGCEAGEDTQARVIEAEAAGMDAPYVCGWTIWCYADHAWPGDDFVRCVTVSPFGVVTRDRRRLGAHGVASRLFRSRQGIDRARARDGEGPAGAEVTMVRSHMDGIPHHEMPEGFSIRPMRPGEGALWTDIQRDAEPFFDISDDLFMEQFGADLRATEWRSFFIVNAQGVAVGTISAWYNRDFKGQDHGMIHWVAVRPAYQRRGLARAGMTHAMERLAQWHDRCMLGTQTKRLGAIRLYLDFGFLPDLEPTGAREAWRAVRASLQHPALAGMDL